MHEDINLLSSLKQRKKSGKATSRLRNLAVGMLLFVTAASMTVFFLIISSPLPSLIKERDSEISDLKKYNKQLEFLANTRDRLSHASKIVLERKRFDNAFALTQSVLPSEVSITGYDFSTSSVSFTVSALSLGPLDLFLHDIGDIIEQGEQFRALTLSSLVFDEAKNVYELTVSLALL
ncbi:MAG: hypothetical protein HYT11_00265 [Candidatus Levybacteria bacterium]|nr:hypothetical protein [Candidatus Levybacteria bacterium]